MQIVESFNTMMMTKLVERVNRSRLHGREPTKWSGKSVSQMRANHMNERNVFTFDWWQVLKNLLVMMPFEDRYRLIVILAIIPKDCRCDL